MYEWMDVQLHVGRSAPAAGELGSSGGAGVWARCCGTRLVSSAPVSGPVLQRGQAEVSASCSPSRARAGNLTPASSGGTLTGSSACALTWRVTHAASCCLHLFKQPVSCPQGQGAGQRKRVGQVQGRGVLVGRQTIHQKP